MSQLKIIGAAVFAMSLLAQTALAAGPIDAGVKLYQAHDYTGALAVWRPLAAQSDPNALFNLGQAYRLGRGVKTDTQQAARYYEQAAKLGHVAAQGNLATLLYFGSGSLKDTKRAVELYHVAARNGDARAQYMLGVLYFNGDDVAKDWPKAYAYTSLAKDAGLPEATETSAKLSQFLKPEEVEQGQALRASLVSASQALPNTTPPVGGKTAPGIMVARTAKPAVAWTTASATPKAASAQPIITPPAVVPALLALNASKPATDGAPTVLTGDNSSAAIAANTAPSLPAAPTIITPPAATPEIKPHDVFIKPKSVTTASPGIGGWHVQLGAYASQTAAESQWNGQHSKAVAAIGTAEPLYVSAGTMVKLQVGNFTSHDAAAKACGEMKTKGLGCFPVKG